MRKLLHKIHDWLFLPMTVEEIMECISSKEFMGIAEKFSQDPEELKSLREMLEAYKKQI